MEKFNKNSLTINDNGQEIIIGNFYSTLWLDYEIDFKSIVKANNNTYRLLRFSHDDDLDFYAVYTSEEGKYWLLDTALGDNIVTPINIDSDEYRDFKFDRLSTLGKLAKKHNLALHYKIA